MENKSGRDVTRLHCCCLSNHKAQKQLPGSQNDFCVSILPPVRSKSIRIIRVAHPFYQQQHQQQKTLHYYYVTKQFGVMQNILIDSYTFNYSKMLYFFENYVLSPVILCLKCPEYI